MEASKGKSRIPWGNVFRLLAAALAIYILVFGVNAQLTSRRLGAEFDAACSAELIRLEVDLTKPGQEVSLVQGTYSRADGLDLNLSISPDYKNPTDARRELDGLLLSLQVQDEGGRMVIDKSINVDDLVRRADLRGWQEGENIYWSTGIRNARHSVLLRVLSPAQLATGRSLRLTGNHVLCGMEVMGACVTFWVAIGGYVAAALIAWPLVAGYFRRRRQARAIRVQHEAPL